MAEPEKKDILFPKLPAELVEKKARIRQESDPTPARSLVFESEKQRNAQFIKKGLVKPGRVSFEVLRRAAYSLHIARICITVLKEKVTKTQWVIKPVDPLKNGDDDKRIEEITELFKHPNHNDETFRTLLDKMLEDLLVLDAVSIEKTRWPDGKLAELHFVDSATIRPVYDEHGNQDVIIPLNTDEGQKDLPVSYVQIMDNSQYGGPESGEIVAAWPKKDFLYFHMHPQGSMEGFGYGLSPLESVLTVVANLLNADNYNGTYFDEGSFPPLILQLVGQMDDRDLEAFREYMYSELQGAFHRPAIMAGTQKAEVINLKDLNNRDMQFMEYTQFLSRLLAAAYGLSGQDIGLTEDIGSKNVAETQKDLSEAKGYSSILHLLKEVFNQEVIWKDYGYSDLEFDWVVDDTTDPDTQSKITDLALKNGTKTLNEVRQMNGDAPYPEWADQPMLLTTNGYVPLLSSENPNSEENKVAEADYTADNEADQPKEDKPGEKDKIGGEKAYHTQDEENVTKAVYTPSGLYRTWFDDRGYGQPFIWFDILTGTGKVIKPPVAVNLMSQQLETDLTNRLASLGLNVCPVNVQTITEVQRSMPIEVAIEFDKYIVMSSDYDSEKWRSKFGGSRKYPSYLVSNYIDGYALSNPLLLKDMVRDPNSYRQAIEDLAHLARAERAMLLGDRRADQYIITKDKRAYGFDYQFEGDKDRYERTKNAITDILNDVPDLKNLFEELRSKDPDEGTIKSLIKRLVGRK